MQHLACALPPVTAAAAEAPHTAAEEVVGLGCCWRRRWCTLLLSSGSRVAGVSFLVLAFIT